jgi:hypothetical protein
MVTTAALPDYVSKYVSIKVPGRGPGTHGIFSTTNSAVYSFLINPSEVTATRQTLDEQALARAGWQIGVFGEDFVSISINGKSAGKYYSYGTTDTFTEETLSYRNLLALQVLFENNGYWFEGEQVQAIAGTNRKSKRIKMHADIELTVGDFTWHGMFETFEITEDAETPFIADFNMVFIAWKETFNRASPYPNSLGGEVQRGHVPSNLKIQQILNIAAPAGAAPIATSDSTLTTMLMNPDVGGF